MTRMLLGVLVVLFTSATAPRHVVSLTLEAAQVSSQAAKPAPKATFSDDEIKHILIRQSLASYTGSCPCPYNSDRAGRRCGARSAYSRPGGAAPLCFPNDVSQKMVDDYRAKTGQKRAPVAPSGRAQGTPR